MYNISQFKPTLYLVVLLGMTGFALAAQSPGLWVIGCGGTLVNLWLVRNEKFRPLPRLAANLITIAAMLFVARQLTGAGTTAVLVIGQFLVALQLVKLWEQRGNRDYAQLLVLSLLLMVAASINTATLGFALLLIAYLFLALYCCLLFHLKVETDAAKAAVPLPEEKVPPVTLRQDQRFLSRSMRRLTGIVSTASIAMAVAVFILFPRGSGHNMLAGVQRTARTLTGFSEQVNLTDVTRISQNNEVVAHVEVFKNGQKVDGTMPLLLRGFTLDTYAPGPGRGQWLRTRSRGNERGVDRGRPEDLRPRPAVEWRQKVSLRPTGTRALFAMATPTSITLGGDGSIFHAGDGVIQTEEPITSPLDYEVISSGELDMEDVGRGRRGVPKDIDEQIVDYARRPEVSGANAAGPLAAQRNPARPATVPAALAVAGTAGEATLPAPQPLDAEIATNFANHLRGPGFTYTLDIGETRTREGQDPYVWFLTAPDGKRGHCEYFAGAMVLMCQSMGMRARMVTGFRCDEYNATPGAGYYIVRQAHAHAWVEVLTTEGWRAYDPTSGRAENEGVKAANLWTRVKHFFDFLEFSYASNVIAYDNENRENLIQAVEQRMAQPLYNQMARRPEWLSFGADLMAWVSRSLAGAVLALAAVAAVATCVWQLYRRWKLRGRAARIGIKALPPAEQARLAAQLGFYDDLLRLLGRHKISRPPHLTPMEFAKSLLYLPSDVYESVRRLTGIFYRVRFGRADLTVGQQRRLANVIARVEAALATAPPAVR